MQLLDNPRTTKIRWGGRGESAGKMEFRHLPYEQSEPSNILNANKISQLFWVNSQITRYTWNEDLSYYPAQTVLPIK